VHASRALLPGTTRAANPNRRHHLIRLTAPLMAALALLSLFVTNEASASTTGPSEPPTSSATAPMTPTSPTDEGVTNAAPAPTPAKVTARDAGALSTTLIPSAALYPTGSEGPQRAMVRDCGHSSALPNGTSLWVFCDTAVFDNVTSTGTGTDQSARLRFVPSGTAALALTTPDPSSATPVQLHEAAYPAMATPYITSSRQFGPADNRQPIPCPNGATSFAWTSGMVTLPGTHTVVSFFQDHCVESPTSFPAYDVGVAELHAPSTAAGDLSGADQLRVATRYDSVFVNPTPGSATKWGYGEGATVAGDHLYVYNASPPQIDCTSGECRQLAAGYVRVARVPWAKGEYRSAANYEYYTGSAGPGWSRDPAAATDVIGDRLWPSGDGISVAWYPQIQRYVMSYANNVFAPTDGAFLRTSTTPWGPWSSPVNALVDASSSLANPAGGCTGPTMCRTFLLHPDLSAAGGSQLYLSYVRNNDWADRDGRIVTFNGGASMQVRLAAVDLPALPIPAPETELTARPSDPTASATTTFAFGTVARPMTVGEEPIASPTTEATESAISYRCSIDSGPSQACASPFTMAEMPSGRHTFTVHAVDADGRADPTPATWTWSIDQSPPSTSIVSGPPAIIDPAGSAFVFAGTDDQTSLAELRYECALNAEAFEPCASSVTYERATTGTQELRVRAVDLAGNVDLQPTSWSWSIDMDPVVTLISSAASFTEASDASFTFTATDDLTRDEDLGITCSLDGAADTPCGSTWDVTDLATGTHTFTVSAVDGRGNVGTATRTWTIDLVAPTAQVSTLAAPLTNATTAQFVFGGADDQSASAALTFACRLDASAYGPCVSPTDLTSLEPGVHEFAVRSTDQTGHVSADAVVTWTVDTAIPSTSFTPLPSAVTTTDQASFSFTGTDDRTATADLAFECSLDQNPLVMCASGVAYAGLASGAHTFSVRAVDSAGNRSSVLTHNWVVDVAAIVGTVRDQVSGAGVPGVRVQVFHSTGIIVATTTTEADGSYRVGYQPSGSYRLSFYDPTLGHVMQYSDGMATLATATPITVTLGSTVTFDAALEPLTTITGVVVDQATGRPVGKAWVKLFDDTGVSIALASTGTDGSYRFSQLRNGNYRIGVSDSAGVYVPAYWNGTTTAPSLAGAATIVARGGTVLAGLAIEPLTTIAGVVTDQATGRALPDIWVTLLDGKGAKLGLAATGADGRYRFPSVRLGTYRLSFGDITGVYVPGYWQSAGTIAAASMTGASDLVPAGGTFTADARLATYSTITGTVTDNRTGNPIAGIYLVFTTADRPGILGYTWTLADGTFSIPRVAPGDYKILVLDLAQLKGSTVHYVSEWYDAGGVTLDDFWTATVIRCTGNGPIVLNPIGLDHT